MHIHVEDSGAGEPVVFVHGSWSDHQAWDAVVAELPGYRLVRYDRRGHSASECPPGQGSINDDVGDLVGLVETTGPAQVVGNSLGAQIALSLTMARPELVRSLALHEPGYWDLARDDATVAAFVAGMQPSLERLAAGAWEDGARVFAEQIFGPGTWESEIPQELKRTMVANAPTFLDEERDPDIASLDVAKLANVTAPTLLTVGDATDPAFSVVVARLAELLPHAELVTLAGAGHVPHRTHPTEYAALLTRFWSAAQALPARESISS
jgi:pimeloyl-ACP methyl ester carboxylesterase